jgi:hypothetical protein
MPNGDMFYDTLGTEEEQVQRMNNEIEENRTRLSRMGDNLNTNYFNRLGSDSGWSLDEVTRGVSDDGKIDKGVEKSPAVKEYIEDLVKELKKKKTFISSSKRAFSGKKPINNLKDMDEYTRTNKPDVFTFYKQGARVGGSKIKRKQKKYNKSKKYTCKHSKRLRKRNTRKV